jgi:hypothetical protein
MDLDEVMAWGQMLNPMEAKIENPISEMITQ